MKLDKHSSVPLYAQLKDLLTERIESGEYAPGEQIPTEMALCEELDLSRPTVRQAIAELVSEGLLQIKKGKGTFVLDEPDRNNITGFSAFSYSFLTGQTLDNKLFIDYSITEQLPPDVKAVFDLNSSGNEHGFYEIIWTESIEKKPFVYVHSYIPVSRFPTLIEDIRTRKRMIDITANKYPSIPNRANWRMLVRPSTTDEARALDISKGMSVIHSEAAYQSRSGNYCEVSIAILNAETCVMHFEVSNYK